MLGLKLIHVSERGYWSLAACYVDGLSFLTLLVLKTEHSGFRVNTIPADALASKVARASAGVVLAV